MSDPLQQHTLGGSRKFGESRVARFALRSTKLDLDEFMVMKGTFGLGDDGGSDSRVADEQDWIQCMPQTPEILALAFCKFHGGIVKIAAAKVLKPNTQVLIKRFTLCASRNS